MADNAKPTNALRPNGTAHSTEIGDVPDALRQRFLTEAGRGDRGLSFYVDATTLIPSFHDKGHELVATRSDPSTVRDLVAIAQHRGWSSVRVQGAEAFRREAWLVARAAGLEVDGYRPSERDLQALTRRLDARAREDGVESAARREKAQEFRPHDLARPSQRLRVAEAVIRDRVADPSAQKRLLAVARSRLAALLERGVTSRIRQSEGPARDRQR